MTDVSIKLTPAGDIVEISTLTYLGKKFGGYRDSIAAVGGIYRGNNLNAVATDQVPALLELFEKAELTYQVDAALVAKFQGDAQDATAKAAAGRDWMAEIDEKLSARGLSLYEFQKAGVRWLHVRSAALLFDQQGLGKSVQALVALPERAAAMLVVPAAVLYNWQNECAIWRPDLVTTVIRSSSSWRWPRAGEVIICTWGCLPDPEDGTLPAPMKMVLVGDELQYVRNAKIKRAKAWKAIAENVTASQGQIFGLTGTPLMNHPPELWNILGALGLQKITFGSWPRFIAAFHGHHEMIRVKGGGVRKVLNWSGAVDSEVPMLLQKVSLRRHRIDVLADLPAKRRATRYVEELSADALRACDAVVEALREKGIDLAALPLTADIGKMISGPVFELMSKARAQLATAKIGAALEMVEEYEEAEEPLLVMSAHKEPCEVIGKRPGWACITGDTPPVERTRIAASFQAGELKGVAYTYGAGGVGITLTRGAYMVAVDLPWNPALMDQGEDRAVRIGQTRGVLITRLVARHPLDEHVTAILTEKQRLIEQAVEASAVSADHEDRHDIAGTLQRAAEAAAKAAVAAPVARPEDAPKPAPRGGFTPSTIAVGCSQTFGAFRPPKSEAEVRTARALMTLAAMDLDRASVVNGMGFNKLDGDFGHSLAKALGQYGRLSEKQWTYGEKLVWKYRGQVGDILTGTQTNETATVTEDAPTGA